MPPIVNILLLFCSVLALSDAHWIDRRPVFNFNTNTENINVTKMPATITTISPENMDERCQCVRRDLCSTSSTSESGEIVSVRAGIPCEENGGICCKISEIETTTPVPARLQGCGYRNSRGLDLIDNSAAASENNKAKFGEFPWVVALLDLTTNDYYGMGVLIHPQVVMTVAHKVVNLDSENLKIRAGKWETWSQTESLEAQERPVEDIRIRYGFNPDPHNIANDIALLRLQTPLELSAHINLICLPSQSESSDNYKNCVANGWGKNPLDENEEISRILKKVELDMIDRENCTFMLRQFQESKQHQKSNISLHASITCAVTKSGDDTCQNDGGAPLVCPIIGDRYKLSGMLIGGIQCGQGVPVLYTQVSSFRQWVDNFNIAGYIIDN